MAAVAEATDIVTVLEDQEMPLAELRGLVDDKAIGRAWAAGLIEFGRPNYCVQSPLGGEQSVLIFEGGCEWTGPKTARHKAFAGLLKDVDGFPVHGRYERADVPMEKKTDPRSGKETFFRPIISHEKAVELLGLRVRLTDKGLAEMAG